MMRLRTVLLIAALLGAWGARPCELRAQEGAIAPSELDSARRLFARLDQIVRDDIANHVATHLTPAHLTLLSARALEIRSLFEHASDKAAIHGTLSSAGRQLNGYWQGVSAAYGGPLAIPPATLRAWNPLDSLMLTGIIVDLTDAERKFFIKYGESSERLNLVEIFLHEWLFTRPPMGKLANGPTSFEPIARLTTLGYQWYADSSKAAPSSPIYEAGLTWYVFDGPSLLRRLNHIGLSATYEHDLVRGWNVGGLALHLGRFEIIGMCATLQGCHNPVVALSKNVSLIPWPSILRRFGQ